MATSYENNDMREVVEYLSEVPGGAELFKKYYVESGLASDGTWQRFLDSTKVEKK